MSDLIDRQRAIDVVDRYFKFIELNGDICIDGLKMLPSVQPEPAIPLSWIETQIEWLKSLDNAFSTLTAGQLLAMVNKWKDEQDE